MNARRDFPDGRRAFAAGFTLIEAMVVIAVVAVIMAIAAPSFREFVLSQQLRAAASDLHGDLLRARSEAVKRNEGITVSRIGSSWSNGWRVCTAACAEVIQEQALSSTALSFSPDDATITYNGNGRPSSAFSAAITATDLPSQKRCVIVDLSGRPKSLKKGEGTCS